MEPLGFCVSSVGLWVRKLNVNNGLINDLCFRVVTALLVEVYGS